MLNCIKNPKFGYDLHKKVKGIKLSFLVAFGVYPTLLCFFVDRNDSTHYIRRLKDFKIKRNQKKKRKYK